MEKQHCKHNIDLESEAQHSIIGTPIRIKATSNFKPTCHPEAKWFEDAGLGLFIHWGISSVHGGIDISWSMMKNTSWDQEYKGSNKLTPNEYFSLADRFNPESYNPDLWLKAAREAGFQYAVLTTKHHDGYALWPSKYGCFSTRTHMGERDLLKPYVEACRKNGLKVGFYYSPPDWYYNKEYMSFDAESYLESAGDMGKEVIGYDANHQIAVIPQKTEEIQNIYLTYIKNQVEELLNNYGKIDLLWFDGGPEAISFDEIRSLQPGIIVNPRMHGYGDFDTPECSLPEKRPERWWEACLIWNFHEWGYQEPHGYRPLGWMLNLLARCRSWKGNLLMNCALKADGTMPDAYYERMGELKDWMKHGNESVFNVEPGPYPEQSNVPVTVKGNAWYLHLLPNEDDIKGKSWYEHLLVPGKEARAYKLEMKSAVITGVAEPKSIKLLRTGEDIDYVYGNNKLEIVLHISKTTLLDDVLVIMW